MIAFSAGGAVMGLTFAISKGEFYNFDIQFRGLNFKPIHSQTRDGSFGHGARSRVLVKILTSRDSCSRSFAPLDFQCYLHHHNPFI
jgi:hypothetical protein